MPPNFISTRYCFVFQKECIAYQRTISSCQAASQHCPAWSLSANKGANKNTRVYDNVIAHVFTIAYAPSFVNGSSGILAPICSPSTVIRYASLFGVQERLHLGQRWRIKYATWTGDHQRGHRISEAQRPTMRPSLLQTVEQPNIEGIACADGNIGLD